MKADKRRGTGTGVTFADYETPQLCDVETTPVPSLVNLANCLLHVAFTGGLGVLGLKECLYGELSRALSRE